MVSLLVNLTIVFVVCATAAVHGANLELIDTGSRLPALSSSHSALYDGDDSIYIIGGLTNGFVTGTVLKYSLTSGAVQVHGDFERIALGGAVMRGEDILYFGGWNGNAEVSSIYSYSIRNGYYSEVGRLLHPTRDMGIAYDAVANTVYTVGGSSGSNFAHIRRYDARYQFEEIGELPAGRRNAAAVFGTDGFGYVFGGDAGTDSSPRGAFRFNTATGHVETLPSLPEPAYAPCAVFARGHAYVIDFNLTQLDPASGTADVLQVDGWSDSVTDAGCVYVPKLDRIYVIGGWDRVQEIGRDQISYVNLGASNPPTTTTTTEQPPIIDCIGTGIRVIPDPFCCTTFYVCNAGIPTRMNCDEGLQFSTDSLQCEDSTVVRCRRT